MELRVSARLSVTGDPFRFFEATLATRNISVGGIFFESTFFMKVGMRLDVDLELPPSSRRVRVRGTVVRVDSGERTSGFALKFDEYFDGSDVVLANFFLAPVLREFILAYAKKHRFDASPEYVAHTADVLAAWELEKANDPGWALTVGKGAPIAPGQREQQKADQQRWSGTTAKGMLGTAPPPRRAPTTNIAAARAAEKPKRR
jgi:hypothetical protein